MTMCSGVDGLSCINGWLYSSIGGMIFSSNRKCSACNPEVPTTTVEEALGPPPTEGCVCWACVATRSLQATRMELVRMTARNIELGVKVQDKQRDLDLAIERANKVSGKLKEEREANEQFAFDAGVRIGKDTKRISELEAQLKGGTEG